VIALSGDLSPAHVQTLIAKYFGDIARGQTPARRPITAGGLDAPKRLVLEDGRARGASIRFAWPSVGFADPHRLALVVLASSLSRDRTGVLSKLLVYDRALATRVAARNFDFERGGLFQIDVFPKPGISLTLIEQLVDSALAASATQPLRAQDLDEVKRANAVDAVTQLQTRALRADTLAQGEMFAQDPVAYAKQVSRTSALTAADVQRAAQRYLTARRVVMSMVPAGRLDLVSRPELPFANVTPLATKSP
jgi:zinc protease